MMNVSAEAHKMRGGSMTQFQKALRLSVGALWGESSHINQSGKVRRR